MPSVSSNANHVMLKWARESAGLSEQEVASAEKIYLDQLRQWENGDNSPTLAMLRRLGKRYKRPTMVFYLPSPPQDFTVVKDFRKLADSAAGLSAELRYALRRAQERQAWASEYLSEIGASENALIGSLKTSDDLSDAASRFRETLKVTIRDQELCDVPLEGFKLWRSRLEDVGFFVFQASHVGVDQMRGAALPDKFAPVIVVNSKDADSAKIFTVLHEAAHLLLGTSALTGGTLDDFVLSPSSTIEKFCNRFASEVVMPREDFIRRVPRNWKDNDDEVLRILARTYCVSRSVVAYRLVECDLATPTYLREKWSQIQAKLRDSGGGQPQHKLAIGRSGPAFVSLALSAYHGNAIHGGELSSLLGMKLSHLAQLESMIYPSRVQSSLGA